MMNIQAIRTRVFIEGENLPAFVLDYVSNIEEGDIIIVTSKVVALSERRTALILNNTTKEVLIRRESEIALKTKYVWLTVKDGMVMANAGIDESNARGKLILLPKDSYLSAHDLRLSLCQKFRVKNLGVLITDSRTVPLRAGVTGVALGYAGFKGIRDYRGKRDIFGRRLKYSRSNIADSLSSVAVCVMGEGNEQQPLAVIKNAPVEFTKKIDRSELAIDINEDMYKPFFS